MVAGSVMSSRTAMTVPPAGVQLAGGPLALAGVACAGDDHEPVPGELTGHVTADPAVSSGDYGDGALSTAIAGRLGSVTVTG